MLVAVTDRGSTEAVEFDDFYAREYGRVVALAYALTGDRGAAEDAAQDGVHGRPSRLGSHRSLRRARVHGCDGSS